MKATRFNNRHVLIILLAVLICGSRPYVLNAAEETSKKPAPAGGADTVIVTVNGVKLTRVEMEKEINDQLAVMTQQIPADQRGKIGPQLEQYKIRMKEALVERFITTTLFEQEAEKLKISVSDAGVDAKVEELKQSLPKGMTLEQTLKMSGATMEKMRSQLKMSLLAEKLIDSQVKAGATPTNEEIAKHFEDNKKKFSEPEKVHARHILLKIAKEDDEKTKKEKRAKIDDLHKKLLAGADFAKTAEENSECPSKSKGGDLGSFSRGRMVKPFEEAAFNQKENEIGPVVETRFGYHIIQVLEHKKGSEKTLDQVKETIIKTLSRQKKNNDVKSYIAGLKDKATIVNAATAKN